jgi:hypothetical protein
MFDEAPRMFLPRSIRQIISVTQQPDLPTHYVSPVPSPYLVQQIISDWTPLTARHLE